MLGCAIVLVASGCSKSSAKSTTQPPPPPPNVSYGHAVLKGKALGGPYQRTIVIDATDRGTGRPLKHAKIVVHGEMTVPHTMTLYTKRLTEAGRGEYKGPYTLIMPGDWTIVVIATSKTGDTSTSSFPVHVTG